MGVSVTMVRALIAAVERKGRDRSHVLAAMGLTPRDLDDPRAQVSVEVYERVLRAAIELSGDKALGLHIGAQGSSEEFDVVGHLAAHAATLRETIQTLARYARLLGRGPTARLHEEGDRARVRFSVSKDPSPQARFVAELAMSGFFRMLRGYAGKDAQPRAIRFAYAAPPHHEEYARVFEGAARFDQDCTEIEFDRAWLDRTQLHENRELYALLQGEAERVLGRIERDAALTERIKERLAAHEPRALPPMREVARELGMSERSLRRRLASEGVEYRDLVQAVLVEAAKRMLQDPKRSIQETAYALGFAAPAAFHRAFKRWTGMTPRAYKASY